MDRHSKVLITGLGGFTGYHLKNILSQYGFECVGLDCDLLDRKGVFRRVLELSPMYVIHLAGVSFAAAKNISSIYDVNVIGSLNLLDSLNGLDVPPLKVILASSATVYGGSTSAVLTESMCPKPLNHYGCSKLSMELMAQNYISKFPILVARPFNYTGQFQNEKFLIPKIVNAYRKKSQFLALGNLHISREFNDVRDVVNSYRLLMTSDNAVGVVNICSGKSIRLLSIIEMMNDIANIEMDVKVDSQFVRENDIAELSGDAAKLDTLIDYSFCFDIKKTLQWLYEENK
jgi:nucleoside-diphosphate-sugar epimerase